MLAVQPSDVAFRWDPDAYYAALLAALPGGTRSVRALPRGRAVRLRWERGAQYAAVSGAADDRALALAAVSGAPGGRAPDEGGTLWVDVRDGACTVVHVSDAAGRRWDDEACAAWAERAPPAVRMTPSRRMTAAQVVRALRHADETLRWAAVREGLLVSQGDGGLLRVQSWLWLAHRRVPPPDRAWLRGCIDRAASVDALHEEVEALGRQRDDPLGDLLAVSARHLLADVCTAAREAGGGVEGTDAAVLGALRAAAASA